MNRKIQRTLPQESKSQRIGRLAKKCFEANSPIAWVTNPIDGDNDYGFDYQIQTVEEGLITDIFRAQLKGSTVPGISAEGEFFSVTIDASTVRYYARVTDPVMLVLCDLSVDENQPKNCPLYYVWIHDELRRVNQSNFPTDQKTITLRVPLSNQLDGNTVVSDYLKRFRDLIRASEALDVVVEEKYPLLAPNERAGLISRIPEGFRARSPALLDVMCQEASTAWPEAPVESLPWYLQKALLQLQSGTGDEAEASLTEASKLLSKATSVEISEYWFLTGSLHAYRLKETEARDAYHEAAKVSKNQPKYVVAWAETELRLRHRLDGPNDFSDVIAMLAGTDPVTLGMRARLIAAESRYDEALQTAGTISGVEGWTAQAIIHTMQRASEQAIAACESGLAVPGIRESTKRLFLILRARARFNLAIGEHAFGDPEDFLPMTDPPGADTFQLHAAWSDIVAAVESLRASGWPANIEFVADIWAAVASMLGRQRDALPLLSEAARVRPTLPILQSALESVAAQSGEFDTALAANDRLQESETKTLRRISLLHLAKRDNECVDLFISAGFALKSSLRSFGFSLVLAILSADRIIKPEAARTMEARLDAEPELAPHRALLNYFRATSQNVLAKDEALSRLEERHQALGYPLLITTQLFHELDATNSAQAERCIALASDLQTNQMLDRDSALHLAQAFVTLHKWQEFLDLSRQSLLRFGGDERFLALKALALDKLGQSAEALSTLKDLINNEKADSVALNTYINIVTRCGFVAEAIESVEQILSAESTKSRQIECLTLLFNLIHVSKPTSQRCVDIAWRIGQLVDKTDEAQEGLFLLMMFAATLPEDIILEEAKKVELTKRLEVFTERFPESKFLKKAILPKDAPPEELLRVIQEVIGLEDEQLRWREKISRQLQRGEIPIPYAWRPRVLGSVADLPYLWEIGKQAKSDQRQLHLTMATAEWKPVPVAEMRGHVPLLDLTSLLVIQDLNLWDHLFRLFPIIAIGQATLIEIQQLTAPLSGSPFRQKCIELQSALKARFEQIIQPSVNLSEEDGFNTTRRTSKEIKELAGEGRFMIYSDDAFFRAYCDPPSGSPPSICTLDVLLGLDETGVLSASETAEKIATLCKWNVGVSITPRYQIAILPSALAVARSVSEAIEILRASPLCSAMFNGVWNPGKSYGEIQGHAGALIRLLCEDERNSITSMAALVGLWFGKARLHRDSPQPPVRVIANLIMQAAFIDSPLSVECSRRLWSIFRELVEIEYGDHMDEAKEREAIVLAGQVAAEIDQKQSLKGEKSMWKRLSPGFIEGTSDYEAFAQGYKQHQQHQLAKAKIFRTE